MSPYSLSDEENTIIITRIMMMLPLIDIVCNTEFINEITPSIPFLVNGSYLTTTMGNHVFPLMLKHTQSYNLSFTLKIQQQKYKWEILDNNQWISRNPDEYIKYYITLHKNVAIPINIEEIPVGETYYVHIISIIITTEMDANKQLVAYLIDPNGDFCYTRSRYAGMINGSNLFFHLAKYLSNFNIRLICRRIHNCNIPYRGKCHDVANIYNIGYCLYVTSFIFHHACVKQMSIHTIFEILDSPSFTDTISPYIECVITFQLIKTIIDSGKVPRWGEYLSNRIRTMMADDISKELRS